MAMGEFSLDEWNYTRKGAKLGLIYILTALILSSGNYLISSLTCNGLCEINLLPSLISGIMLAPFTLPAIILWYLSGGSPIVAALVFPLFGIVTGGGLGLLLDLNKRNKAGGTGISQKEKGVFIRIRFFGERHGVIREGFVNAFIIAEIVFLLIYAYLFASYYSAIW